jgi:hypothetical protein
MLRAIITVCILVITTISFAQQQLPKYRQGVFSTSGNCAFCHTTDFGANILRGKDVSQATLWRSTMMANASKDPFWRAKVDAELSTVKNTAVKKAAADLCLKCHAPMGYTQAVFDGKNDEYIIDKVNSDPLAIDGVSCTLCHQIQPDNLGKSESYTGNYRIGKDRKIFGPYKDVFTRPMSNHEDLIPQYGEHLTKSELCATCHTVITPHLTQDDDIKGVFFEQTAYLEWKNSVYPETDIQCQSCHMPATEEGVDIASRPPWDTTKRKPFFFHQFAGGNTALQNIFSKNAGPLNLSSAGNFYEDKLKETESNLKDNSLSLNAVADLKGNALEVNVKLENQTGHKLPTGIPFRRMWLHLTVKDKTGKTVFESGGYDAEGNIKGTDENYEKHYTEITDGNQVQIYEAVMVDTKGNNTFSLLKADKYIKDNRIPPTGFTTKHTSYDTTAIFGNAKDDKDFNKDAKGNEGSGSDVITYRIKNVKDGEFTVEVEVLYQSMNPSMIDYFKKFDSQNVTTFISVYKSSKVMPVIMKSLSLKSK